MFYFLIDTYRLHDVVIVINIILFCFRWSNTIHRALNNQPTSQT